MKYQMKAKLTEIGLSFLLVLLTCLPGFTAGPWSHLRQLPATDSGVKVGLVGALFIDLVKQRYYIVDPQGGQLVSFDKGGKFLSAFNAGGELKTPVSLARTPGGVLWVVDRADNELLQINPRQQKVQRFSVKYSDGTKVLPAKVVIDGKSHLFVLDQRRGSILRLDDNLNVIQEYSGGEDSKGFVDFKLKGDTLWALDGLAATAHRFSLKDKSSTPIKLDGLEFPVSLEVDGAGQLYILDRHAGTVVVYGPYGERRFEFLGKGKRNGQLWFAEELVFDWDEKLCVVDEGNGRVDILTR